MKNKLFVFISSFIAIVLCSVNLATAAVNHGIISVASTAGNITVNGNTFDNLQITPSLVFNQTGDSITYQMTLQNPDNNKFQIKSVTDDNTNQYITTSYSYNTESSVDDKTIYITLSYSEYVPTQNDLNLNNMIISINIEEDTPEPDPDPDPDPEPTPDPDPDPEPTPDPTPDPKIPNTGSKYISNPNVANVNYLPYIIIGIVSLSIIFSLISSKHRRAHFGLTILALSLFSVNMLPTNQTHASTESLKIYINTQNITAKPLVEEDTLSISFPNIYNHSSMTTQYTGGDSIILKTIDNKYALIDTGNSNDKIKDIIYNRLKTYQNSTNVNLDYLIISHLDSDHHGNAVSIINDSNITIRNLIVKHEIYKNYLSKEDIYTDITTAAKNKNINIITSGDATTQNYMNTLIGNTDYTKLTEGQTIPLGNKVNLYLYNTTNVYAGKQCVEGTMLDWSADITKADLYKTSDNKYVYIDGSEYPNVVYRTTTTPTTKKDNEGHEITGFNKYYYAWDVNYPHSNCTSNPNSLAILAEINTTSQKKYAYFPNDIENAGYSTLQSGAGASQVFNNLTFDGNSFVTDITPDPIPAEINAANSIYNKIATDATSANISTDNNLKNIVIYQMSHHGANNNETAIEKLNLNRANGIYAIQEGSRDMATNTQFGFIKTYWYTLGNIPANRKIRVGDTTNNGTECTITNIGNTNCANY